MTPPPLAETRPANHCPHGVLVALRLPERTLGLLITGAAGIGKSELALELIQRGHALIADDTPCFQPTPDGRWMGHCPDRMRDFLEIRGLGILNIRRQFGDASIIDAQALDMIVQLVPSATFRLDETSRLEGMWREEVMGNQRFAHLTLPVQAGRPLALLVETGARVLLERRSGYNAAQDLSSRLARHLDLDSS